MQTSSAFEAVDLQPHQEYNGGCGFVAMRFLWSKVANPILPGKKFSFFLLPDWLPYQSQN